MKYRIVEARNTYSLENKVKELLKEGWKLQGTVVVKPAFGNHGNYYDCDYMQVLVKEGEK